MDCSNGTCDGCSGVFGFDFSSSFMEIAEADAAGTVNLTLVRLAGTDGEIIVEVSVTGGNATGVLDYGGTWPRQVLLQVFVSLRIGWVMSPRIFCMCLSSFQRPYLF